MNYSKDQNEISTKYIIPQKVVLTKNTVNADMLLNDNPRQSGFSDVSLACKIKKGGSILLDFGCELHGGVVISTHFGKAVTLHIVFGESVSETMSTIGEKNSCNDHAQRDYTVNVQQASTFETGNTGFRFVKITAEDEINITCIQARLKIRDIKRIGSFECSDTLLNKIWDVGAYTMQLNMQEYIWDGIKRDRLVWIGDMHPEVSTVLAIYGNNPVIEKSLDFVKNETPDGRYMNDLPSYSMQWVRIMYDLYMHTGDIEYLESSAECIFKILKMINVSENGEYDFKNKRFVDWSSANTEYETAGFHAVMRLALVCGARLCRVLKNEELAKECESKASALLNADLNYSGNKQVTAVCNMAGLVSNKEAEKIMLRGGASGLSCFMGYYVLCSLFNMGNDGDALDLMREYWGGMIKMGATTFWEDFDISWMENSSRIDEIVQNGKRDIHGDFGKFCYKGFRHSLCHGWSSGPTAALSRYVLGIEIVQEGFRKIKINPHLGKLAFAKGTYPTPYGEIFVSHVNKNGKIESDIKLPKEIEIV